MSDKLTHLLPCPFCGCTKVPKRQGNGIGDYWLECFDCGASTRLREDGAGMEKDWNRRASPAPAIPAEPDDEAISAVRARLEQHAVYFSRSSIEEIVSAVRKAAPAISESEDAAKLERSIEQWRKCDPDLMSRQSQAAIFYALKDAKHDILALDAARKGGDQ